MTIKKKSLGVLIAIICSAAIVGVVVATKPHTQSTTTKSQEVYTADEVAKHSNQNDCWTIIEGSVYDITDYISEHPGGTEILRACGKDATTLFDTRHDGDKRIGTGIPHSSSAHALLENFKIGTLTN